MILSSGPKVTNGVAGRMANYWTIVTDHRMKGDGGTHHSQDKITDTGEMYPAS